MKKLGLCLLMALVGGCSVKAGEETASQTARQSIAVATYNFGTLAAPGKCLDVQGGNAADGTNVQEWQCNGTPAQSFRAEDIGNGLSRLVNTGSGKCLDVAAHGTGDGTNLQLWTCNGQSNQAFSILDAGSGNVRIVGAESSKCVDVSGAGTADGTNVQIWSCNGTNAQLYRPAAITLAGGRYNFGALASPGKCMDMSGGDSADGTNIQEWQCNGTGAQSFRVESLGGNAVRLVNTSTGKCVDISGAGSADGTNIQEWQCNGSAAQSFHIDDAGGGNVRLMSTASNKCVDVSGSGAADGTNIQLWSCNGTDAQLWRPAVLPSDGSTSSGSTSSGSTSSTSSGSTSSGSTPPPGGGWTSVAPRSDGVWVRVRNLCPFTLWIHGAGGSGVLQPDNAALSSGAERDYVAPNNWPSARVTAYVDGPGQNELDKAEMTFGNGVLNYNVTYVDWVGLPIEMEGVGGNCTAADDTTGCFAKESQILAGCPEGFLLQGRKCLSARTYCSDPANQGSSYCHALDGAIASCPSCPGGSTPDAYACSGPYANNPRMCAALNRGMTENPDSADESLYYQNPPYNTYAKWVHQVCPNIYAFPYDDWQGHGGFRACSGDELRITFCPSG